MKDSKGWAERSFSMHQFLNVISIMDIAWSSPGTSSPSPEQLAVLNLIWFIAFLEKKTIYQNGNSFIFIYYRINTLDAGNFDNRSHAGFCTGASEFYSSVIILLVSSRHKGAIYQADSHSFFYMLSISETSLILGDALGSAPISIPSVQHFG